MIKDRRYEVKTFLQGLYEEGYKQVINAEIRKKLKLASSTVSTVLYDLKSKGYIEYSKGLVTIKEEINDYNVLDMCNNNDKIRTLYEYLIEKVKQNEGIPQIKQIMEELNMTTGSCYYAVKRLDKMGKIKYKRGKIKSVQIPNITTNEIVKQNTTTNDKKVSITELKMKFDKTVKDMIIELIKALPNEELTSDDISTYTYGILKIANRIKEEIFDEK